jgi:hypothetical protein
MPLTRGFILCVEKALKEYEEGLKKLLEPACVTDTDVD